jgi:hypothetical protein
LFAGTTGQVPDTLPDGNLFMALTRKVDGGNTLTDFVTLEVNANDTIALGNAGTFKGHIPLFLQQNAYVPTAGGPTAISTTAGIIITRLE